MHAGSRFGRLVALAALGAGGLHFAAGAQDARPLAAVRDPAWAPGGARIAVSLLDQIWTMAADGREPRVFVVWPQGTPPAVERDPAWAPDGRRIAFAADLGSGFDLYLAEEGSVPVRLTITPGDDRHPSWTPDGRLVFAQRVREQWGLMSINVDGAAPGAPPSVDVVVDSPADEQYPAVSPDGTRVAYVSSQQDDRGGDDLWVRALDGAMTGRDGLEPGASARSGDDRPWRVTT